MKRIKKLSVMLLCCLLLSVIAMPVSASAAKLNKKSISLNVGKTYTLKASGTKGKITWTSSKKSVATVSSKGVVKAKKKGTAVITAKYGKKKLACKVTVKQPVKSIKLNKTSATLKKGKSLTLKATISPSSANSKAVTWTSSKKSVATVSSKGVVKAKKKGAAVITAKYGKKKLTCKVTVKQPVKSIKLNKTSATLKKGKSLTLKATISPSSANNKAVTWSSSNKKVATVSSKGVVKAVGNGTATITVKVKDGSGKKATCKITVGTTNTPSNNTPIHTAIIGVKLNLGMINVVYGNHELHTKIDLTGDGNADQLDIQATGTGWSDNKFNGTLSISVNGKNAQKFALLSDNVCISYIALKNNIQIIRVQSGYSYSEDDFFIQYNKATNKFQTVLNEKLGGFSHAYTILDDIAFNGNNTIKIKYLIQPYLTGAVNVEYTYVYSNGVFKRASDTAATTSLYYKDKSKLTSEYYQDGYQNYFYDNKFVAMKNLVFYSSPSGKNNFTLKKGAVATLEGFCSKDNNNYMIFKYNGQRGYIKLEDNQKASFYGVSKRMVG